jgi:hypothetical protein
MVNVQIITRHGNSIGVEVEDLDEARKLLSNQFVVVNGQDRFTAIAVSSIDLLDAVETWIASMKSEELNI